MKKKLAGLDKPLTPMSDDDDNAKEMFTRRKVFRLIGNIKAESADAARRVTRIISMMRDPKISEILIESDDIAFLRKELERNAIGLTGWAQGQMLEIVDSVETVNA